MVLTIVMLLISLGFILLASIVFTNAIELLGSRMKMHQGATGSILAAVGTALPETVIPIIAILFYHDPAAHQVGIGAIAGAPFMLGTLAFCVTGAAVFCYSAFGKRSLSMHMDLDVLSRDLTFFIILYGLAIIASFFHGHFLLKLGVALILFLAYACYVRVTFLSEGLEHEKVEPLHLVRFLRMQETLFLIIIQLVVSLALMIFGAHLFVDYVRDLSLAMGVSTLILSMIITPIATELPEKCNSIIWIGQRKDVLAMGNITGAMVFQSSFPVAFGVLLTPWDLRGAPMISATLALLSAGILLLWIRMKRTLNPFILIVGGIFYLFFIAYLVYGR